MSEGIRRSSEEEIDAAAAHLKGATELARGTTLEDEFPVGIAKVREQDSKRRSIITGHSGIVGDVYDYQFATLEAFHTPKENGRVQSRVRYTAETYGHPPFSESQRVVNVDRESLNEKTRWLEHGALQKLTGARADRAAEILKRKAARSIGKAAAKEKFE